MQRQINSYKPLAYAAVFAFSAWLLVFFLSHWETFTHIYYPNFYAWLYPKYAGLFGWIPFSVGDIFYALLIVLFLVSFFIIIRCFIVGQKWRGIRIIARLIKFICLLYVLFHLAWGFNYYKPNLTEYLDGADYTTQELKQIANDCFDKAYNLREQVKEDSQGVFAFKRPYFYTSVPSEIRLANFDLKYSKVPKYSFKKYSLYSLFMRYAGVGGYYNPFTAEAQITRLAPTTQIAFTMAHEQAHQMGYAMEYEANFIGYLTSIQSHSNQLKYSANYKALKSVLRELYPRDSIFVRQKLDSFSVGMQRDYNAERKFYEKYSGRADEAFSAMNNVYLKANNQEEGIESYNRFVELLVGYYRKEKSNILR